MEKSVCFISIFDLTIVQYEQAIRLQTRGHRCYWMTTNKQWTHWLLSRGVSKDSILELVFDTKDFLSGELKKEVIREVVEAEAMSNFTVNMAMLADRFVMNKSDGSINDYALLYFYNIKRFFENKSIEMVFGEPTNLNELISQLVCKYLNIPFLYPQDLRIPSNRFFFELGSSTGAMVSSGCQRARQNGKEILGEFLEKSIHPKYFYLLNLKTCDIRKVLSIFRNRLSDLFIRKQNLTHHRFINRLQNSILTFINKAYLKHVYQYNQITDIQGKKAFFGLHVQPEASIDVAGPYFSDQLKLIKDMRRALPFDTALVVKEHPNFLGQKSFRFFRKLKFLPNVYVVHPQTSTFDIYKSVNLVLTVSGTIAYEAGLLGIPTIIFSKQFFNGFSSVHYCSDVTQLKPLVMRLLDDFQVNKTADYQHMDWIIQNSYAGYWTDPHTDSSVLSAENLDKLFVGFLDVVEGACCPRTPKEKA